MADNTREPDLNALVVTPGALHSQEGKLSEQALKAHLDYSLRLGQKLNGGVSFGSEWSEDGPWSGNIDGQLITVTSGATPDTEFAVFHGLGRVALGFIILGQSEDGFLKESSYESWTEKKSYFKCSGSSVRFRGVMV